ncbi:thaumatin-like protein 1b [Curcuma longa]|uniref:thaumatin-like protein 1b n=1 Tax=Curcuma longa TaxID=136217 RepID=UPI003D9F3938
MATMLIIFSAIFVCLSGAAAAGRFTVANNCQYAVWPGVLSGAGEEVLETTGFELQSGESRALDAPAGWSGRFWGRTLCATDSAGEFACATGDCGSGAVECSGKGAAPPATLAEFTLGGGGGGLDFYDVSLVDGYNVPMLVAPQGAGCNATGCAADLNARCPADLRVAAAASPDGGGESVACRSACDAFGSPQYCCSGAYASPDTCKPTPYSEFFKKACPRAYSYAYDDATSTFTCAAADYLITFCPNTSSQRSSGLSSPATNNTVAYGGGGETSGAKRPTAGFALVLSLSLSLLKTCLLLFR